MLENIGLIEKFHSLDNREIATLFWLAIFLTWCLKIKEIRSSLPPLIYSIFATKLIIPIITLIVVITTESLALHHYDLWSINQFKIAVILTLIIGVPTLGESIKIAQEKSTLTNNIRSTLGLSILVDFFINLYKFPLFVELVFVPTMALIAALIAISSNKSEYKPVKIFLEKTILLIVGVIICFQLYKIAYSFSEISNKNTILDFACPLFYMALEIPLIWIFSLYVAYEEVFIKIKITSPICADHTGSFYVKFQIIKRFKTNIKSLNEWIKSTSSKNLKSKEGIVKSLRASKINSS
ncbi:hypothetical protein [Chromobacterium sphagni]|uniref:hypothetical protein n=1 Tax=Chromobacterium sphagni TaxID=1903179 RepID=UPI001113D3F9|nr:hypothetical protein [Chromobacterium sphagni]